MSIEFSLNLEKVSDENLKKRLTSLKWCASCTHAPLQCQVGELPAAKFFPSRWNWRSTLGSRRGTLTLWKQSRHKSGVTFRSVFRYINMIQSLPIPVPWTLGQKQCEMDFCVQEDTNLTRLLEEAFIMDNCQRDNWQQGWSLPAAD